MILSMTGYGKSERKNKNFCVSVEIKSINNRFFDPIPKIHPLLREFEKEIMTLVKDECIRGRVFINLDVNTNSINQFILNKKRLVAYIDILEQVSKEAKIDKPISLSNLLKYPDIIENIGIPDKSDSNKVVITAVKSALKDLKSFRKKEGINLLNDINNALDAINKNFKKIEILSKKNINKELVQYKKKIKNYMPNLSKLDDDRLYQEIAIILEKKDINEELIRFKSHMQLFSSYLKNKKNEGKKKNFLLQEMNREVNTIGAKSDNTKIRHLVVDVKDNLEKLREQVQNIL
tara:strand:- start:155 stop:1027 length:873 start_codon:yes stop_codon:yes gene_type:complete